MIVLAVIIVILILLVMIPVGVFAEYSEDGFLLALRILFFNLQILPGKGKKEEKKLPKKKKEKVEKKESEETEKPKKGGDLGKWLQIVKPVLSEFRRFLKRIVINTLILRFTIAGADDPASSAILYGRIAAASGNLHPVIHSFFRKVRKEEICCNVDFEAKTSLVYFQIRCSLHIYQIIYFVFKLARIVLPVLFSKSKKSAEKELKANG